MGYWDTWVTYSGSDKLALSFLKKWNIEGYYSSIDKTVNGIYSWHTGQRPIICIDHRLQDSENWLERRSCLFELLGYHATASREDRRDSFIRCSLAKRDIYEALNNQALRWAGQQLIKDNEIWFWAVGNAGTLSDFAESFHVTTELAAARIYALRQNNPKLYDIIVNFTAIKMRGHSNIDLSDLMS